MKPRHIHFIGIGGIGVSGIAQLALKHGEKVTGSDLRASAITQKLVRLGAEIFIGHEAGHVVGADLVVYSSAIRQDNAEIMEARKNNIPVKKRAEFLNDLMTDKTVVTVTGAHGKTTTSSLAAKLLLTAGLKPTVAVGGILREDGDNMKFGDSSYFVAEADESDGTFLCYTPTYSLITNIDREHLDYYGTYEALRAAFETFVRRTKPGGCVIYFQQDRVLERIVTQSGVRSVSYGMTPEADLYPLNLSLAPCRLSFDCASGSRVLGRIEMGLVGRHNIANALAVVALGREMGLGFGVIQSALKGFKGVERRFQVKYETKDIFVVDDYAHHPTEIAATIEAARLCTRKRVVVVFQPHRFSRTKLLLDLFPRSFEKSDYLVVTDIYGAGEDPVEGVTAQGLTESIRSMTHLPVDYVAKEMIVGHLRERIQKDDLVLFLGAGDITRISDEFAKSLRA
ncbi:MAG: UDP-N-acetylmuramate--L-alanine ligase [Candidatus Omnitrophica bacterium]|nr:UDP-N-acetylmuramate--L-alanine ligase [Candidatus Omnitrophota bacterium]MDD5574171.1 UDP-N-acetylmuramate--L-alanine ligase [Candidatus Omnitrophota bacterium]